MKAALAVLTVTPNQAENLARLTAMVDEAADAGAELLLFPETALTGLINNDDPEHDLRLGVPVPGNLTDQLGAKARSRSIWLAVGLFERDGSRLYDTALLFDPQGRIVLHYRRNDDGWHAPDADPGVYSEGDEVPVVRTPLGSFAFLICGDLFEDRLVAQIEAKRPDYLLNPTARSFDGPPSQEHWDREEMDDYAARVQMGGSTCLMVNYLSGPDEADGYFGGAWVIRGDGHVLHSMPLGQTGLLLVDL